MTISYPPLPASALEECAREAIHVPGQIQPFGVLLTLAPDGTIAQASCNARTALGLAANPLGTPLGDLLPSLKIDIRGLPNSKEIVDGGKFVGSNQIHFRIFTHFHDDVRIVELIEEPDDNAATATQWSHAMIDLVHQANQLLALESPLEPYSSRVAQLVREMSGYDRVMVYRFDGDYNGQVIAESVREGVDSYLGLWYPASDIPPQARDLYLKNRLRLLSDVSVEQVAIEPRVNPQTHRELDLTYAVSRSFSPIHREYLTNMGVRGTLVASIVRNGKLWGLIACHHLAPRVPTHAVRALAGGIAELLATHITTFEQAKGKASLDLTATLLRQLPRSLDQTENWAVGLLRPETGLLEAMNATGIAISLRDEFYTMGTTPDIATLRRIRSWCESKPENLVVTERLQAADAELANQQTVCGLLALAIPNVSRSWIMWFRPEHAEEVTWAGDTRKGLVQVNGQHRLSPRNSFAAWIEVVRGRSRPWTEREIALAVEVIRPTLLEVLISWHRQQALKLKPYYGILFEQVADAVILTDMHGHVLYWNEGAKKVFGWTAEEMVGRDYADRVPPQFRSQLTQRIRECAQGRVLEGEWIDYRKDGSSIWMQSRMALAHDDSGDPIGIMGILRDITDRKLAQQRVEENRRLYQLLADNSHDVIYLMDAAGKGQFISPAIERQLGYTPDEFLRVGREALTHEEDLPQMSERLQLNQRGQVARAEWRCRHKNGNWVWLESIRSPVLDERGCVQSIVCCMRNITERKELEEQYRQSQKMETLGQLASGVAHDFNNVITVINGYVSLLLEDLPAEFPERESIEGMGRAAQQGARIAKQLLAFSRQQVLKMEILDLNAVLKHLSKTLLRLLGGDIRLETQFTSDTPLVLADRGQMEQVIINLAINARDAMQSGGTLTLETSLIQRVQPHDQTKSLLINQQYSRLRVSDTGCGIAPEIRNRIFEPFFTTKDPGKGTGLGLATVSRIIRERNGWIELHSEVNQGTTFDIYLPGLSQDSTPATYREQPLVMGGHETILVAEDDEVVRVLVARLLTRQGYRVLQARDGLEAVEIASRTPIDLLITDVIMPKRSGKQLAIELRATSPNLPILFMTGDSRENLLEEATIPNARFLFKPFVSEDLLPLVRQCLDRVGNS
jgi:PAS domain S-box-containing protein